MNPERIKSKLANKWIELENEYSQLHAMLIELDEFNDYQEELDIKTTTVYILLEKKMEDIAERQKFYERLGALK